MQELHNNTDDLLTQRRTVDITKQAINELTAQQEMNLAQAEQVKATLEAIFDKNFKEASSYERAMYTMKRPFQFVYNKITDPNASYLERFAYGAAVTVGVVATGYAAYRGGKYAYSALQYQQKKFHATPEMKQVLAFNELEAKINQKARNNQEKRKLYEQNGFIWDPVTNYVKNKDNTFLVTGNNYKVNGKWLSSEERNKVWDIIYGTD